MPLLTLSTNQSIEDKDSICKRLSSITADMLGKPESYVMVMVEDSQSLIFAGSNEPAAYVQLKSLGLPEADTGGLSQQLCQAIEELTGIDSSRTYIEFSSPARHMWGWDNRTF